ncbi:aspartate-semialdehyde dehydrogenase, partial [Chloroflexota bacterium]
WARAMKVEPSTSEKINVPLVFSALPSRVAVNIERDFAASGAAVCSNASAYRDEPDVPILLPEVNPEHTGIIEQQRNNRNWRGFIVTNSNCTSTGITVTLKALDDAFGVRRTFVVSLQALSGAGYPGVPSIYVLDNVLPYIAGEEDKVEWEPRKMLGHVVGNQIAPADFVISAHTNRVAVSDGHTVCMSVELDQVPGIDDVSRALESYSGPGVAHGLPSSPQPVISLRSEPDRPQPRLDRLSGKGMTTVVGRLRPDTIFDYKMVVLSHNIIRGAAGGSIYNAELLVRQGLIG